MTGCTGDIPDVPKAGVATTLATGGGTMTLDVVVGVVGIELDGDAIGLELTAPELAVVEPTEIGGTETASADADVEGAEAFDVGGLLMAALLPDVQAVIRTSKTDTTVSRTEIFT